MAMDKQQIWVVTGIFRDALRASMSINCRQGQVGGTKRGGNGDPGRIRTCDTRIRNPVLYPLSYGTTRKSAYRNHGPTSTTDADAMKARVQTGGALDSATG